VKHKLRAKYYVRYVDDFVILHKSKEQLLVWKKEIENFLITFLDLNLHKDKSKIINLSNGVDFVGFRNFYYFRLLGKRNIKNMNLKLNSFFKDEIEYDNLEDIWQGWCAYSFWANSFNDKIKILRG